MAGEDWSATNRDAIAALERRGYTGQFRTRRDGEVECLTCRKARPPGRYVLERMVRVEGQSDPDDMTAVVGLLCECGARGTEVFTYGVGADAMEMEALAGFDDHRGRPQREAEPGSGEGWFRDGGRAARADSPQRPA